jgi:nucleotide-binding universal stress UspA family protein
VALDGSPFAAAALGPAQGLAQALAAGLVLLRAVEPPGAAFGGALGQVPSDPAGELADANAYLDAVAARLPAPPTGPGPARRAVAGAPAPTIAAVAGEAGVSAVAMATHGRSGLARAVLGSVATEVLHRTTVPVLFVRPHRAPAGAAPAGDRGGAEAGPA